MQHNTVICLNSVLLFVFDLSRDHKGTKIPILKAFKVPSVATIFLFTHPIKMLLINFSHCFPPFHTHKHTQKKFGLDMCQGHQGTALSHHGRRAYVCLRASVCLNMSLCSCEVGAVAKGMPWLRGASQPADSISLEVAAPSSFIRGDRPRRCLPAPLTGRDHANAATARGVLCLYVSPPLPD